MSSFTLPAFVPGQKSASIPSAEREENRKARIAAYMAQVPEKGIYHLGRLLALAGMAQDLANGASIPVSDLTLNGTKLTMKEGTVISLETLSSWGCLACKSAHGSHKYPSNAVNPSKLATNLFYFNSVTGELFTISSTCWDKYFAVEYGTKFGPVPTTPTPKKGDKGQK